VVCLQLLQNNSQNGNKTFISIHKELTALRASGDGNHVHKTPELISR